MPQLESDEKPAAPPGFPLRVAAVDVGSNAIRFVAAEFTAPLQFQPLEEVRVPVRLGHDVFLTGRLAAEAVDAAVAALADFRDRIRARGISHYRAVATSATREARNGDELVARVRAEAGLELEVITASEEARLGFEALRSRLPLGEDRWLLVDLGGGSLEISLVDAGGILWTESHVMGSVRLLEELQASGAEPGRFQRLLREYAATLQVPALAQQWKPRGLIAAGGNIEALARLTGHEPRGAEPARLTLVELRRAIELLGRLSYRQRVEQLGLKEDRADVIVPAAMVYERLAALAGVDELVVPGIGLKEGLLIDVVDDVIAPQAHEDRRERQAMAGVIALGRRYFFDEPHALHVARLAGSLFDQLQPLHRLHPADRRILLAAAVLHDIGIYVGYKRHHKHSLYLIAQSEIPEFSPLEIALIANLARYHRKGVPAPHHEEFTRLSAEDRDRVVRLAALLRVADALDREHVQAVQGVRVRRGRRALVLELDGTGDLLLERWALRRKGGLFEETFGLPVEVRGGTD